MATLGWIILGGVGMSAIALVGGLAALLPQPVLDRILLPIVGLAAGSLLGGAFFHMLPSACLLYTSDAADERSSVDLGGRRIIKKKKTVDRERETYHERAL